MTTCLLTSSTLQRISYKQLLNIYHCWQYVGWSGGQRVRKARAEQIERSHLTEIDEETDDKHFLQMRVFYRVSRVRLLASLVFNSLIDSLLNSLLFSRLDWCDPGVWRCQVKTCFGCYFCWCWCWETFWRQFGADFVAEVWSYTTLQLNLRSYS